MICGQPRPDSSRSRCDACYGVHDRRARALIDGTTPYDEDKRCQYVVEHHPHGLTLDQIGDLLGLTRERVRQIEAKALERLVKRMRLVGLDVEDLAS